MRRKWKNISFSDAVLTTKYIFKKDSFSIYFVMLSLIQTANDNTTYIISRNLFNMIGMSKNVCIRLLFIT